MLAAQSHSIYYIEENVVYIDKFYTNWEGFDGIFKTDTQNLWQIVSKNFPQKRLTYSFSAPFGKECWSRPSQRK